MLEGWRQKTDWIKWKERRGEKLADKLRDARGKSFQGAKKAQKANEEDKTNLCTSFVSLRIVFNYRNYFDWFYKENINC